MPWAQFATAVQVDCKALANLTTANVTLVTTNAKLSQCQVNIMKLQKEVEKLKKAKGRSGRGTGNGNSNGNGNGGNGTATRGGAGTSTTTTETSMGSPTTQIIAVWIFWTQSLIVATMQPSKESLVVTKEVAEWLGEQQNLYHTEI